MVIEIAIFINLLNLLLVVSLLASEILFFFNSAEIGSAGFKSDPLCQTLKSMTTVLCSYMAQMGDNSLVLQIVEKVIIDQIVS